MFVAEHTSHRHLTYYFLYQQSLVLLECVLAMFSMT